MRASCASASLRRSAAKRSSTNNHARCGRSPKMPRSSLRRNAPARCHQYAEKRAPSGKPDNGTGHRQPETGAGHVHWGALGSIKACPPLSLEGVSQMGSIPPERLLALVRPAFDLVLRRIRSLKRRAQACGCKIMTPRYAVLQNARKAS